MTTWIDGGSAGAGTFEGMREWVLSRSRVRMLAFLNISAIGLAYLFYRKESRKEGETL